MTGLFAVPGRVPEKILQKQQDLVQQGGLFRALRDAPGLRLDEDGVDLLAGMLTWDPQQRISPEEALSHPYLARLVLSDVRQHRVCLCLVSSRAAKPWLKG